MDEKESTALLRGVLIGLLAHHRIRELKGTSDTLDDRIEKCVTALLCTGGRYMTATDHRVMR